MKNFISILFLDFLESLISSCDLETFRLELIVLFLI